MWGQKMGLLPVIGALTACTLTEPAPTVSNCAVQDIESGSNSPENLGNGFVGTYGGVGVPEFQGSFLEVVDCRTEDTLTLYEQYTDYWGKVPKYSDRRKEFAALRSRMASEGIQSLESLRAMAANVKIETKQDKGSAQICGCAAFYPEMRGAKPAFGLSKN